MKLTWVHILLIILLILGVLAIARHLMVRDEKTGRMTIGQWFW